MRYRLRADWLEQCEEAWKKADGKDYIEIPLTQGQKTKIDRKDFELVRDSGCWCVTRDRYGFYARKGIWQNKRVKKLSLSRFLLNAPSNLWVDHINHDTLDNRRENLRLVTPVENTRNRVKHMKGSSRYLGVCWDKASQRWLAQIMVSGKNHNLGRFRKELDAVRAYNNALLRLTAISEKDDEENI